MIFQHCGAHSYVGLCWSLVWHQRANCNFCFNELIRNCQTPLGARIIVSFLLLYYEEIAQPLKLVQQNCTHYCSSKSSLLPVSVQPRSLGGQTSRQHAVKTEQNFFRNIMHSVVPSLLSKASLTRTTLRKCIASQQRIQTRRPSFATVRIFSPKLLVFTSLTFYLATPPHWSICFLKRPVRTYSSDRLMSPQYTCQLLLHRLLVFWEG